MCYHHASTALQGRLVGEANRISALGEYLVDRAIAEYIWQHAKDKAIDAEYKRIRTYWRVKNEYIAWKHGDRVSLATLIKISKDRLPKRLAATELTPMAIHWPAALRGEGFAPDRAVMERAFASRASDNYGAGSSAYADAVGARDRILATLRGKIGAMPTTEYIEAKRFIKSLAYEVRFPVPTMVARAK